MEKNSNTVKAINRNIRSGARKINILLKNIRGKKVEKLKTQINPTPLKTWSRKSTIIPEFIGISFLIHNGKKFIPIKISEEMVGHKLGEFSPTRQFSSHTSADKKAAQVAQDSKSSPPTATKPKEILNDAKK